MYVVMLFKISFSSRSRRLLLGSEKEWGVAGVVDVI